MRDGKLYVEGEKEPYFREPQHTIQLRVHSLTVRRGYQPEDWQNPTSKKKALKETLHGLAENNEFNVIGLDKVYSPSTSIEFLLASVPDTEREFYWHTTIGFHAYQYEGPGEPHWPRGFWVHGYCPSQYLDDLLAAVRRGHVDNILVEMQTTMWTRNSGTYSSGPWHLARPTDQSSEPSKEHGYRFGIGPDGFGPRDWFREAQAEAYGAAYLKTDAGKKIVQELDLLRESNSEFSQPASEQGYISSLFWEEKFGLPKDQVKEIKPQAVELPTQLYSVLNELRSMLGALIAILMVLAFLLWR